MHFRFEPAKLQGLTEIYPFFAEDSRGYFLKSYEKEIFLQNGIETDIFEDFESYSYKNVIRGMHFQTKNPQSKLVRAIAGEIFDVAVDLRPASKTFGKWEGVYLTQQKRNALFIPKGFAHGFLVLSESALVSYKCSGKYLAEYDTGLCWNDPSLGIDWPMEPGIVPTVSDRDRSFPAFSEYIKSIL